MEELKKAKKIYESIEIPKELDEKVQQAIKMAKEPEKKKKRTVFYYIRSCTIACACVVFLFVVLLNTSGVFASAASNVPVIGAIAKVLTIRSYEKQEENTTITVEVPKIETKLNQTEPVIEQVNQRIEQVIEEYVARAEQEIADYKEAFLATGGTEEEFKQRDIDVSVSYEIKSLTPTRVSFVLLASQAWYNFSGKQYYYNVDLEKGKEITLEDLLGENWATLAENSVRAQMKEQMKQDEEKIYWQEGDEVDDWSITENTGFYINEAGNPVIVFEKYEVAPGYMGTPEFELQVNSQK